MHIKQFVWAALFIFNVNHVYAQEDLYSYRVQCAQGVKDPSAIQNAMTRMLERLTADPAFASKEVVQEALKSPQSFIAQYTVKADQCHIRFNRSAVDDLINRAGAKLWGSHRPKVVVWPVLQGAQKVRFMNWVEDEAALEALQEKAQSLGLQMIIPLMDIEDMQQVAAEDITGPYATNLWPASLRYQPDVVATLIMHDKESAFAGKLSLVHRTYRAQPEWITGETNEALLTSACTAMAKQLLNSFGIAATSNTNRFTVKIEGIQSSQEYIKIQSLLSALDLVEQASIKRLDGASAAFEVLARFDHTAQLAQQLEREPHLLNNGHDEHQLSYRWVP